MKPGTLYVVATPIGNMEDITLRALRVLGQVPILAAEDTRSAQHLLVRHGLWPRSADRSAQMFSFFTGNEAERTQLLMRALSEGQDVALLTDAGTPSVSDPGQRLVKAAAEAGIRVEALPGPSAALCALVGSGLPTDRFLFVGFPPRTKDKRQELFASLRHEPGTLIFYESPDRTAATLSDLATVLSGDRPACVARELTKIYEEFVRGPLSDLAARYAQAPPRGEVTLLVEGQSGTAAQMAPQDVEAAIKQRLKDGQGAREIAASLALLTGKPRRQIYQAALVLQRSVQAVPGEE